MDDQCLIMTAFWFLLSSALHFVIDRLLGDQLKPGHAPDLTFPGELVEG
jgi:hypothetical protein